MAGQEPLIWPQQDDPDEPRLTDGVDEAGESLLTPSPHDDPDGSDAQPPDGLVAAQLLRRPTCLMWAHRAEAHVFFSTCSKHFNSSGGSGRPSSWSKC